MPSIYALIGAAAISALLAAGASYEVTNAFATAKYDKLVLADKDAQLKAVALAVKQQKDQDAVIDKADVKEATAQQEIDDFNNKLLQGVHANVTPSQDARTCITYGLVRVLDAAVLRVEPLSLQIPAGKTVDACAPIKASDLAISVAYNYGIAAGNNEQLDALIAEIKSQADKFNAAGDEK